MPTDEGHTKLPAPLTEAELAEKFKTRFREAIEPTIDLMNEAKDRGLQIEFQLGQDFLGRAAVVNLFVVKRY